LRLSQDFDRLDRILEHLAAIERRAGNPHDEEDLYILADSVAYELQQLYTGFEKVVERHF